MPNSPRGCRLTSSPDTPAVTTCHRPPTTPRGAPARTGLSHRTPFRPVTASRRTESQAPATPTELPCLANDPDLWFAEHPEPLRRAQQLCATCPVIDTCLAGALQRREPHGVWGGEIFVNGVRVPTKRGRGRPRRQR